jgi:hypothetical protein
LFVRTSCYTQFAADTVVIIYLYSTILVIIRSPRWANIYTWSFAAIIAKLWQKTSPDAWINSTFPNFHPGSPYTQWSIKLSFTSNCARMASHAFLQVDNHHIASAFYSLGNRSSFFLNDRNACPIPANAGVIISSCLGIEHFCDVIFDIIYQNLLIPCAKRNLNIELKDKEQMLCQSINPG